MKSCKVALLTTPSTMSADAVLRLITDNFERIAVVGISDPLREPFGPCGRRSQQILLRSHLRLGPYLFVSFVLPRLISALRFDRNPENSLAALCRGRGVPVIEIDHINDPVQIARLRGFGAQAALMFHFDQIVDANFIATFPDGVANVHPGLLPRQRGASPTIHALMDEIPDFGVTLHRVTPVIDQGAILAQTRLDLPVGISAVESARRLHLAALPLVRRWLDGGLGDSVTPPQLAYCYWPDAKALRALARRGRRLER